MNFVLFFIGYPLRKWLQTPISNPAPGSPEERFNNRIINVRNSIERCNGLLKNRFRCLLKHRVLHYSPQKAAKIVNACVLLHNLCINGNVPEPEQEEEIWDYGLYQVPQNFEPRDRINPDLIAGRQIRQRIINIHFNNP